MKALRLYADSSGRSRAEDFRMPYNDREGDTTPFTTGTKITATSLQFVRQVGLHVGEWKPAPQLQFIYVLSGRLDIEVTVGPGRGADLAPGDLALAEDTQGQGHRMITRGDCRLLFINVEDWKRDASVTALPRLFEMWPDHNYDYCKLSLLYTGQDNRSHYKPIEGLFPDDKGTPGLPIPLPNATMRFIRFPEGYRTNWHPESSATLALFHAGIFEMIGGPGEAECFTPGDLCMVADVGKSGEGHMHGHYGDNRITIIQGCPEGILT